MKTNYTLKVALMLVIATFCFTNLTAQVRILKLDPATNSVTLKNFGASNVSISGYWFCNFPVYDQVSEMTTVTSLDPGEEVNIGSTVAFAVADGEFGLYSTNANGFGTGAVANMLDYMQWGSANHQREPVAVSAGIWGVGTFINIAPPFEYTGDGTQNGVANWSTLGIDNFQEVSTFKLYPNPTNSILNIEIQNAISNGTLEVYDLLGKQIYNQTIIANNISQIDVANWNSGLYLIKISSEDSAETRRFVKN